MARMLHVAQSGFAQGICRSTHSFSRVQRAQTSMLRCAQMLCFSLFITSSQAMDNKARVMIHSVHAEPHPSEPGDDQAKAQRKPKPIRMPQPKAVQMLQSGPRQAMPVCDGKGSSALDTKKSPSSPIKLLRLLDPIFTAHPPNLETPGGLNVEKPPKSGRRSRHRMKSMAGCTRISSIPSLRLCFLIATCVITMLLLGLKEELAFRQESILAKRRNQAAGHRRLEAAGLGSMQTSSTTTLPTATAPKFKAVPDSQASSSSAEVAHELPPRLSPAALPIASAIPPANAAMTTGHAKSAGVVYGSTAGKVPQESPTCDLNGVHIIFDGIMYKKEHGQMLGINKMWFEILPFMGEMVRKLGGKITHCASYDIRIPNVDHVDGKACTAKLLAIRCIETERGCLGRVLR